MVHGFPEGPEGLHSAGSNASPADKNKQERKGSEMASYIAVDLEAMERSLKNLPPLPLLLIHLACCATRMNHRECMKHFSEKGILPDEYGQGFEAA